MLNFPVAPAGSALAVNAYGQARQMFDIYGHDHYPHARVVVLLTQEDDAQFAGHYGKPSPFAAEWTDLFPRSRVMPFHPAGEEFSYFLVYHAQKTTKLAGVSAYYAHQILSDTTIAYGVATRWHDTLSDLAQFIYDEIKSQRLQIDRLEAQRSRNR